MTEFKGRHLGFLAILCGTWIAARVATNFVAVEPTLAMPKAVARVTLPDTVAQPLTSPPLIRATGFLRCCNPSHGSMQAQSLGKDADRPIFLQPIYFQPTEPAAPSSRPASSFSLEPALEIPLRRKLDADVYAYSFWRFQAPGQGLAAGGQYGGSQSGLIATIGFAPDAPALLLRTAVAHDNLRDREFAVGARWRPKADWPISVTAERRFRNLGPDSFALYVAGGRGDIRLPAGFKLETYAQVGVLSGNSSRYFFDAQARADRRILPQAPIPLHVGTGVWAGGQRGTQRLDIGPSLRTEIPLGDIKIRLTTDWRFRIAGNAAPGNGPALTLSTGF